MRGQVYNAAVLRESNKGKNDGPRRLDDELVFSHQLHQLRQLRQQLVVAAGQQTRLRHEFHRMRARRQPGAAAAAVVAAVVAAGSLAARAAAPASSSKSASSTWPRPARRQSRGSRTPRASAASPAWFGAASHRRELPPDFELAAAGCLLFLVVVRVFLFIF